jgi:choline dehydrogenase-like flavoprotein
MICDLSEFPDTSSISSDVCVIGAGPAGITVSLALAKAGKSVILCEGGGDSYSQESQDQYNGIVIGDPYHDLKVTRLRYLGGSSNHWSGWCRPLDAIDFEKKSNFPKAYWPIQKNELDGYTFKACEILEISAPKPNKSFEQSHVLQELDFSFSHPPVRFKTKFQIELATSKKIQLILNANLCDLDSIDGKVVKAIIKSFNNRKLEVNARSFIFAMGGIENSRMLLWTQFNAKRGLADSRIPIGAYWMEHPHFTLGEMLLKSNVRTTRYVGLSHEEQKRLAILNCGMRLQAMEMGETKRIIKDLICVAPTAGQWAADLFGKKLVCGSTIRAAWEQEPLKSNRIQLSKSRKDMFGIPLTELHWKKSENDFRTVRENVLSLNDFLIATNRGRLRLDSWLYGEGEPPADDEKGGHHHMGGTRMADSPFDGVVDLNCRVFGTKNLYVAGSSVFPSGGHANPTFTIVQLSLRLADHLKNA